MIGYFSLNESEMSAKTPDVETPLRPTRRGFPLIAMSLPMILAVLSGSLWYCSDWLTGYPGEFTMIFQFTSNDPTLPDRVLRDLKSHGIAYQESIGKWHTIFVARRDRVVAIRVVTNASYFKRDDIQTFSDEGHSYKSLSDVYHDWQLYGFEKAFQDL
jgi:hypothetical protein